MHHTVHFMAITTERQLLPAKAARGWQAEQADPDAALFRALRGHAARVLNQLRTLQTRALQLPGQTGAECRPTAKRLTDVLG